MQLVTFTSDFGQDDYYEAALKGAMFSKVANLQIIDVSNNVEPYDIITAAFLVKNAYPNFPKGTIHIVSVDNYYDASSEFILLACEGQYFIAPNNGVLSMIAKNRNYQAYKIKLPDSTQVLDYVYANTVYYIANGLDFSEIATPVDQILERTSRAPVVNRDMIRGTIIHVDHYGNAITNIDRQIFDKVGQNRKFGLFYKPSEPISKLSKTYSDVGIGTVICFFNASSFLEIAVNKGKANTLLGLDRESIVQVVFDGEA